MMNRVKLTGEKVKFRFKLIALIIITIILNACPPLEEDPYNNTITIKGDLNQAKWMEILIDIYERGMPVDLDLSACTVPIYGADILKRVHKNGENYTPTDDELDDYIQFDPLPGFPYGKEFIKSIILPEKATMIKNAADINIKLITDDDKKVSAFRHFTNLRSITGENIRLIGNLAFIDCKTLEEVNFDSAVHIMQYAFSGCTGLKEMRCENVRDILSGAFENCTNLQKADFPDVRIVSQYAFRNCSKITEVIFTAATKIGDDAFRNCTSLKIARFPANPERNLPDDAPPDTPPLQWIDDTVIVDEDSVIFSDNAFRGCKSLEILDVRNAWNVYFAGGALADIGEHLELFLFDDGGVDVPEGKSFGHPQLDMFLGDIKRSEKNGGVTLKTLLIRAPAVTPPENSQILFDSDTPGCSGIKSYIDSTYNGDDRDENNEPLNPLVKVTVQRGP